MSSPSIWVMNMRQRVEPRLHLAPIVIGAPVANELLEFPEPHALRPIIDGLSIGPPRCTNAPTQIVKCRFWNLELGRDELRCRLPPKKVALSGKDGDTECGGEGGKTLRRGDDVAFRHDLPPNALRFAKAELN